MKKYIHKIKFSLKALAFMVAWGAILFTGCKRDAFLLPDRMALDENMWNDEGAVQLFLNGTYSFIMPDYPFLIGAYNILYASDESIYNWSDGNLRKAMGLGGAVLLANDVKIIGTKQQGKNKGENKYADIYRCNLGISQLHKEDNPLSLEAKREFIGQFFMLRAIAYFDLVKTYGGVPVILEPLDPSNVPLIGRSSAEECFKVILNDLDSAIVNLDNVTYTSTEYGKLTKLAASAYKARVMLYRASPLFNPIGYPGYAYSQAKWDEALVVNKTAYDLAVSSGRKLMDNYGDIFLKEGTENTEAIVVRSYSEKSAKRSHEIEYYSRPGGPTGGNSNDMFVATDSLVAAYTMDDGTPASSSADYDAYFFWKNRDPRFYATIAYNGSTWALNGIDGRKQWTYVNETEGGAKPFYCKRFSVASLPAGSIRIVEDIGGNGLDWIELRFAEVLLNYAECLNETGDLMEAKNKVRELRMKRGIKAGTHDYGLDLATNKEQMRDLIMNERRVEFAFEGKRGLDLRRTRRYHLLSGTVSASRERTNVIKRINQTSGKEEDFDLRKQLEEVNPENNLRRRDTLDLENKTTLQYFFTRIPNGVGNTAAPIAIPQNYYFYPIPNAFLLSSPLLEQTVGWENGKFDPLL